MSATALTECPRCGVYRLGPCDCPAFGVELRESVMETPAIIAFCVVWALELFGWWKLGTVIDPMPTFTVASIFILFELWKVHMEPKWEIVRL